eukprot:415118-Alexandrium_andersonii.AAC.1
MKGGGLNRWARTHPFARVRRWILALRRPVFRPLRPRAWAYVRGLPSHLPPQPTGSAHRSHL